MTALYITLALVYTLPTNLYAHFPSGEMGYHQQNDYDDDTQRHQQIREFVRRELHTTSLEVRAHDLSARYQQRERAAGYCKQNVDAVWARCEAQALATRCKVINFRNGGLLARQLIPPSPLPTDFVDNFGHVGLLKQLFILEGDLTGYHREWQTFLKKSQLTLEERQCHERAQMRRWNQYEYSAFWQFLQTLSVYESYLPEIVAQYQHDKEFAEALNDLFPALHWKTLFDGALRTMQHKVTIRNAQIARDQAVRENMRLQQLHAPAKQVYDNQKAHIESQLATWNTDCPQRTHAYQQTSAEEGKAYRKTFAFSPEARRIWKKGGYDEALCTELEGNALQQQLMAEIVTAIEKVATIKPAYKNLTFFVNHIQEYTLKSLHGACVANAQGNCANSAQLLDFGKGLCNYTTAVADGVHSGITGILSGIEALQHPGDTLKSCAQSLAYLLSFLPIKYAHYDHIMSYEEWGRLFRKDCERADQQWKAAKEHMTRPLLVQMFTTVAVGYLTHAVLRLCAPHLAQGAVYAGKVTLRVPIIAAAAHATIRTLNTLNNAVKKVVATGACLRNLGTSARALHHAIYCISFHNQHF